jgi:hypothetical protein
MVYLLHLLHTSPLYFRPGEDCPKRRGQRPPEAEGGQRGATPRATHGSLRAACARGRASAGQRARPGGAGGHRYRGTARRDLQRLERWGHKDIHWSHTPPYSLRLSPPTPSHSLAPPRASSSRPTPSKPRAPPAGRGRPGGVRGEAAPRGSRSSRHRSRRCSHHHRRGRGMPGMVPLLPYISTRGRAFGLLRVSARALHLKQHLQIPKSVLLGLCGVGSSRRKASCISTV